MAKLVLECLIALLAVLTATTSRAQDQALKVLAWSVGSAVVIAVAAISTAIVIGAATR